MSFQRYIQGFRDRIEKLPIALSNVFAKIPGLSGLIRQGLAKGVDAAKEGVAAKLAASSPQGDAVPDERSMRGMMRRHSRLVAIFAVVLTVICLGEIFQLFSHPWATLSNWAHPQVRKMVWYYDLTTEKLFAAADMPPPVAPPSGGVLDDGTPAGVRARVFSCTDCSDESKRFIASLATAQSPPALDPAAFPGPPSPPRIPGAPGAAPENPPESASATTQESSAAGPSAIAPEPPPGTSGMPQPRFVPPGAQLPSWVRPLSPPPPRPPVMMLSRPTNPPTWVQAGTDEAKEIVADLQKHCGEGVEPTECFP